MNARAPLWSYDAVDPAGHRSRGVLAAPSAGALVRSLEEQGLVVVDAAPAEAHGAGDRAAWRPGLRRDVLEATRALAALLSAGVPLARALAIAAAITPGRAARALERVRTDVAGGESLAASLERQPALFPPLYAGVVRAGERGGRLADAFASLAAHLEREDRLRARLLGASVYPMVLAVAALAAVGVLLFVVLPRFAELLDESSAGLPRSTATLLALADVLARGWPWMLALLLAAGVAATAAHRTSAGRKARAALLVRLPVIGDVRRHVLAGQLARLLGVLLAGGASLLAALEDVQASLADPLAREEVARVRGRVHDGASLSAAVAEGALFPPLLARLLAVGEEAGRLEELLERAAEICEERADRSLQRLVALAEPALVLVLGAIVAGVALALLQAIYGVDASALR